MKVCGDFASSIYSKLFILLEIISIIILFVMYLRKIIELWNNPNNSYDKIDLILIYLSEIQLIVFFLRLCQNYNIFSVLIMINKFSQNLMICSLLVIIILGKYTNSKIKIINYFLITLLIADIILFLIGINDKESFDKSDAESMFNVIISFFCIILNSFILYKSYLFKIETNKKIEENLNNNKLVALRNYNSNENINNNNGDYHDNNEEGDFFNTILNQHLSNAVTILSVYFNILIPFLISYFMEIILYFFFSSNDKTSLNDNEIIESHNNNTIGNESYFNNEDLNYHINLIINEEYKNNISNTCIFLQDYKTNFGIGNLIVCFLFFLLRDFLPYFMTYLMFFYYKLKYHQRFSF